MIENIGENISKVWIKGEKVQSLSQPSSQEQAQNTEKTQRTQETSR